MKNIKNPTRKERDKVLKCFLENSFNKADYDYHKLTKEEQKNISYNTFFKFAVWLDKFSYVTKYFV